MSWEVFIDALAWLFVLSGSFFLFIGSLGMVRLKDFWARIHAASIIDSAGAGLLLFGMMLGTGFSLITVKLVLIVLFLAITGPTASHAVVNAAFSIGSRPKDLLEDATEGVVELPEWMQQKSEKPEVVTKRKKASGAKKPTTRNRKPAAKKGTK
ncbi:MAG: monovalent cation/H(+) antiporter subunit G [Pseudomonadota bacterium]